ncbi:helicase ARIP4-like isoform X2 [Oscarella lobularis]|uniref:helicase ARIP4-like isoform X2 n=1 Tax=Oscarella lobularis TaxID=121494 RepID=UPI003313EF62
MNSESAQVSESDNDNPTQNDNSSPKRRRPNHRRTIRKIRSESELADATRHALNEEQERRRRQQDSDSVSSRPAPKSINKVIVLDDDDDDDSDSDVSFLREIPGRPMTLVSMSSAGATYAVTSGAAAAAAAAASDVVEVLDSSDDDDEARRIADEAEKEIGLRDGQGRVLVNPRHAQSEPDIFVHPRLSAVLKPHQILGIRFLYGNLVESVEEFGRRDGFGCILAHCMGLGKTLQVIAFTDVFLTRTKARTVLCVVPINTLQNWVEEYNRWLPQTSRSFSVFVLNESQRDLAARAEVIRQWHVRGGVLLIGYEMYRMLALQVPTLSGVKRIEGKKPPKPKQGPSGGITIDLDLEEGHMKQLQDAQSMLCNPGPDLVVCDEGHRIKNNLAGISQALKKIRTKRRLVLTGYPLQNNLAEYWCMIDFVRPNYVGTHQDFSNMFEYPIYNGQCVDSTSADKAVMRQRAHVLHKLVEGFVQRRGHKILKSALSPKKEYVLFLKSSPIQQRLYEALKNDAQDGRQLNPIKVFSVCLKIWNDPDLVHKCLLQSAQNKKSSGIDLDVDDLPTGKQKSVSFAWAKEIMKDYEPGREDAGAKMPILLQIIDESVARGDRLLVFSQSLATLDLIEDHLSRRVVPSSGSTWTKNEHYYRLDGSTVSLDREQLVTSFNSPANKKVYVFLLSTKAGCLGISLVGANRVVLMDVSWNPCHDAQAVCRIYRYGQNKPCYVYRLVADGGMERRIYERQITKRGVADRVIDELQPEGNATRNATVNLLLNQREIGGRFAVC